MGRRRLHGQHPRAYHINDPDELKSRLVDYIADFWDQRGFAPSVREITAALAIRSTSTTHHYLNQLIRTGALERERGLSRTLRVPAS